MKVLYVVGACLTKNTSANLSHNGYIQGLLENGCELDIIMAEDSWGQDDRSLPVWDQARYFCYPSSSLRSRFLKLIRGSGSQPCGAKASGSENGTATAHDGMRSKLRGIAKTVFYKVFPNDPKYPLEAVWLKKAAYFRSDTVYDLVVSNSSPAASHKLVGNLLKSGRLKCGRWVQIWEDPWFFDLYGGYAQEIREEEHTLLRDAGEIYYVSPLTLRYQQRHYSDCGHKMKHIPLPYFDFAKDAPAQIGEGYSFGYFGDYYSRTRNIAPFYEALTRSGFSGYICGDSDVSFSGTSKIKVSGRVTLDVLDRIQAKTQVLVHLCNLRGGQIPGKIYHYCATSKPILFILDGTQEEQTLLKEYFGQWDRFCFCDNNAESILAAMRRIIADKGAWTRLEAFSPQVVVKQLL